MLLLCTAHRCAGTLEERVACFKQILLNIYRREYLQFTTNDSDCKDNISHRKFSDVDI